MAYRKAHGKARDKLGALAVIETCPPDELPAAVPAPAKPSGNRDKDHRLKPGPSTSQLAALGGKARAESIKFRKLLGLVDLEESHPYHGYLRLSREHRESHSALTTARVGGGELSPGASSIIASASMALGASRYLYDQAMLQCADMSASKVAKLFTTAMKLADQSRIHLLTAHELAAREAAVRGKNKNATLAAIERMIEEKSE